MEPAGFAAVSEVPHGAVDDRGGLVQLLRGGPIVGRGLVPVGSSDAGLVFRVVVHVSLVSG